MIQGIVSKLTNVMINYGVINPVAYKGRLMKEVTDTAYTALASDAGFALMMDNAAAQAITLTDELFNVGDEIEVYQLGVGAVTFAAAASETINGATGPGAQYGRVVVKKTAAGVFNVAI